MAVLRHPGGEISGFVQSVASFAMVLLVMLGVGGTVYQLVAPGGLLAEIFSRSVAGGLAAVFSLVIVGFSIWQLRDWVSAQVRRRYPEVFVYAFAAAGLFYAVRWYSKEVF